MEKDTAVFLALAAFFCGITVGFLIAPAKNGIMIGSHNGNQIGSGGDPEEYIPDEEEEEDENYAF